MRVTLEGRAFVDGFDLGDDAVGADLAPLRHLGANHDEIVELQVVLVVQHDPELTRGGVLGAEHAADSPPLIVLRVGHVVTPVSRFRITALRRAR